MEKYTIKQANKRFEQFYIDGKEEFHGIEDLEYYNKLYVDKDYKFYGTYSEVQDLKLNARYILEELTDDIFEDAIDHFDVDELQGLLDDYLKRNQLTLFYPDYESEIIRR